MRFYRQSDRHFVDHFVGYDSRKVFNRSQPRPAGTSTKPATPKPPTVRRFIVGQLPNCAATNRAREEIATARAISRTSPRSELKRCETYKPWAANAAYHESSRMKPRIAFVTLTRSER